MEQRSPEWYAARLGKVTASRIADVVAKTKTGVSASRAKYCGQLVAERLTGKPYEGYTNAAMEWGTVKEADAVVAYELYSGLPTTEAGFIDHPHVKMAGASPDRIAGDGLVECKCPETHTHINTLLTHRVDDRYIKQMQWQMACTGAHWVDYVSFDPRLPAPMNIFVQRVAYDRVMIYDLEREVAEFLGEVDDTLRALRQRYPLHPQANLKDKLKASLALEATNGTSNPN